MGVAVWSGPGSLPSIVLYAISAEGLCVWSSPSPGGLTSLLSSGTRRLAPGAASRTNFTSPPPPLLQLVPLVPVGRLVPLPGAGGAGAD